MAAEFNTVDVWIGEFPSRERFDAYFNEMLDPDNDDAAISEFAEAMQERYYDHDFIEYNFSDRRESVEELLRCHSYSISYSSKVTRSAVELGVYSGNTVVLVWGCRISNPVSVVENGISLKYIGRFDCDPSLGA